MGSTWVSATAIIAAIGLATTTPSALAAHQAIVTHRPHVGSGAPAADSGLPQRWRTYPSTAGAHAFGVGGVGLEVNRRRSAPPATTLPGGQALLAKKAALHSCAFDDTLLCGKVTAPLDRFGTGSGTVDVRYVVAPHTGTATHPAGAIFATSGGPGNSITGSNGEMYPFLGFVLAPLTRTYDIVFVDQRGVGRSGAIDCPKLQHHGYTYQHAAGCAARYAAVRNFYSTAAVADDIDDIRADLGYDQIIAMGGSYAGTDMVSYAARHPDHTARVVIASPAPPFLPPHQFDDLTPRALPGYVVRACQRSASCDRAYPHPRRLVAWLVHRLRHHPVTGIGYDPGGNRRRITVTESTLAWHIMINGDFPFDFSQLPGAAAALRAGDKTPLLRLAINGAPPPEGFDEGNIRDFSLAEALFRSCVDDNPPWDESAPRSTRYQQYSQALASQPRRYGLFARTAWAVPLPVGYFPSPCIVNRWQHRPAWPPGAHVGGVPTLILTGDMDNGLATSISREVTGVLTDSKLVKVEQAGHNPWFWRACARTMVRHFIRHGDRADLCAGKPFTARWQPGTFPTQVIDAPPAHGLPGDDSTVGDRRVATVAVRAVLDMIVQLEGARSESGRGLRGGTTSVVFSPGPPKPDRFRLHGVRFTRDVAVTGRASWDFDNVVLGRLDVRGPGIQHATLHVKGRIFVVKPGPMQVRGYINGRHVVVKVPSS